MHLKNLIGPLQRILEMIYLVCQVIYWMETRIKNRNRILNCNMRLDLFSEKPVKQTLILVSVSSHLVCSGSLPMMNSACFGHVLSTTNTSARSRRTSHEQKYTLSQWQSAGCTAICKSTASTGAVLVSCNVRQINGIRTERTLGLSDTGPVHGLCSVWTYFYEEKQ